MINHSPTITPIKRVQGPTTMNFAAALDQMVEGKKIRRMNWEDKDVYLYFNEDDKSAMWINKGERGCAERMCLSTGDVMAEDWIVVRD